MSNQGRADRHGPYGQKVEPNPKAVDPGWVSQIGTSIGNHAERTETDYRGESKDAGRGYRAPSIGSKTHRGGSQGSY